MALRKVGGNSGPIFKWDAVGKKIVGFLLRIRDGKQFAGNAEKSKLADFRLLDGSVIAAGAPKMLANRLADVALGTYVEIAYLGQERGQAGVLYKDFDVQADDERRLSAAEIANALAAPRQQAQPAAAPAPSPSPQPSAGVQTATDVVGSLEQKLRDAKGTQIGDLMISALRTRHAADPVAYLGALSDLLKAAGVVI